MKNLLLTSLAVVLASCALLTAPEKPAEEKATKLIGVVLPNNESRWSQDSARFQAGLVKAGFEVSIKYSNNDSAMEATLVNQLAAQEAAVLILCPVVSSAAASSAELARNAGMKVIAYDRLITNTTAVDRYITFDSVSVGQLQGQFLANAAKNKGIPLYLYGGASGDNNAFLFFEGSWKALQPKIADGTFIVQNSTQAVSLKDSLDLSRDQIAGILSEITTNWSPSDAANLATSNLATGLKGTVAVLAPNDGTARALSEVFRANGSVTSLTITGQDADRDSIQAIIDGTQTMTILKDVRTLVDQALIEATALANGKPLNTAKSYNNGSILVPAFPVPTVVVTKDNVRSAVINTGYYSESDFTGTY